MNRHAASPWSIDSIGTNLRLHVVLRVRNEVLNEQARRIRIRHAILHHHNLIDDMVALIRVWSSSIGISQPRLNGDNTTQQKSIRVRRIRNSGGVLPCGIIVGIFIGTDVEFGGKVT